MRQMQKIRTFELPMSKARKETIVEKDMESCQMEAVMIPNSSPKEAMVQEQVTEKAVASKAGNEDVENAKMDTSTTPSCGN
jgi:hypothetical protein